MTVDDKATDGPPSAGRFSVARNALRSVVLTPLFMLRHARRSRHVVRTTRSVQSPFEPAPEVVNADHYQAAADGVGPLVIRQYSIEVQHGELSALELMRELAAKPNRFSDTSMAAFMRRDEAATDLEVGDQLVVELAGPWNGPVEVLASDDDRLLLVTLDGHMEAGIIRFDTAPIDTAPIDTAPIDTAPIGEGSEPPSYRFRITSWARAGDATFKFFHLSVPIGRELQTAMWVAMCRRAAQLAGSPTDRVDVLTETVGSAPTRPHTPMEPRET